MPIKPQYRYFYPIDWRELSIAIRFGRAGGRCEQCRRPHGQTVLHLGDGRWWDEADQIWRTGQGKALTRLPPPQRWPRDLDTTRVVLACAHLDHDPTNNRGSNLRAFCQRCHMLHDRQEHQRRRATTYRGRRALGDLFLGQYHWR